jgi:hypothetical protein
VEVEGECGRLGVHWVLVDEVCAGTDDPAYLDYFRAPMMRDGVRIGDRMYAVDATHLWVLDVTDDTAIERLALTSGLGEPLAVAEHSGSLLIAAGSAGLLQLDLADPTAPAIIAQVALDGPALDVHVDGDQALVTAGHAGVAVVDLSGEPSLTKMLDAPGAFAAGVASKDGLAYVAACDSFDVIDIASGAALSSTWVDEPYDEGILVAPAKDVEIVDDVAFVAAGRFGAVAVDVSDPAASNVVGNCTEANEQSFYASGVRAAADGGDLYVAAGEWGVRPIETSTPLSACSSMVAPVLPELPGEEEDCGSEPPWELVNWAEIFPPPPPGRDPIQTLPHGDIVYAFGDARRVGMRAVDVRNTLVPTLDKIGRYDEPRKVTGIAAAAGRVLVLGPAGGVYLEDEANLLVRDIDLVAAQTATSAGMLADGRYVLAEGGTIHVEGALPMALGEPTWSQGLAVENNEVVVPMPDGAIIYDPDAQSTAPVFSGATAELPQAVAMDGGEVVLASPEWLSARRAGSTDGVELTPVGLFDLDDIMSASLWRAGLPRRLLVRVAPGVIAEVATLAGRAGLAIHGGTETHHLSLPAGEYVAGEGGNGYLYLITASRGSYRSQLITIDVTATPEVLSIESFTGLATDLATSSDRLYVADADRGVRVYDITQPEPAELGTVTLEVTP